MVSPRVTLLPQDPSRASQPCGGLPGEVQPEPFGVDDPVIGLAYGYLCRSFRELVAGEPRAREGLDPEGVHQMRVALRRIRAALRAFRAVLPARPTRAFNADFQWLAGVLGAVRDLDVQQENVRRELNALPSEDAEGLADYRQYLADQWCVARRHLLECLASERYRRSVERFRKWLDQGPSRTALRVTRDVTVRGAATRFIDKRLKKVGRCGRRVTLASPAEEYHALRIQCKRLRYLCEFFQPVYGQALTRFIRRLKRLQTVLGELQDAKVAGEQLQSYAHAVPVCSKNRRLLIGLGQLINRQRARAADHRASFRKPWRKFDTRKLRKQIRHLLSEATPGSFPIPMPPPFITRSETMSGIETQATSESEPAQSNGQEPLTAKEARQARRIARKEERRARKAARSAAPTRLSYKIDLEAEALARMLEEIAVGVRAGCVRIKDGERELALEPRGLAVVRVKARRDLKKGLSLRIRWTSGSESV